MRPFVDNPTSEFELLKDPNKYRTGNSNGKVQDSVFDDAYAGVYCVPRKQSRRD